MKFKIFAVVALVFMSSCGIGSGTSGTHAGVITDVSVSGWFCKTWEGQIMSGAGNAAQSYDFTVTSDAVAEQLKEAQKSGNEVIVHYFSPRTYGLCESSNSNFVDAVEVK